MVMPVRQRCPTCGNEFMGSDCLGQPCDNCRQAKAAIEALIEEEKKRRIYYQNIVYAVCRELDRAFSKRIHRGEGTVCGTVDTPSTEVQDLMRELVDRDHARALKEMETDPGQVPELKGRRCPKCQSLMIHTRLGGYRCNRGCQ